MAYTTINKGSSYFNTVLYTGNSTSQSITVGFQPDFLWFKNRNSTEPHAVFDSVRPFQSALRPNSTIAEYSNSDTDDLSAITSTGFSLNGDGGTLNFSGNTYVCWNWLAANSTTSNTSGTISSVVSVNTTSGFSIVSWTGDGSSSSTVGHGLGVKPGMIILKSRSFAATSYAWMVYQGSGAMNNNQNSVLNSTLAADGTSVTTQGQIYPPSVTSSVFGFASGSGGVAAVNGSSATNIAYCFSAIKGFSKFGSYTGNGNDNGTFTYTGFKPAFIMLKRTDVADSWFIMDTKTGLYNSSYPILQANLPAAEFSTNRIDLLSNGFKQRYNWDAFNASGGTYIYMAFAENPFVTSGGIPVTAR